MIIHDHVLIQPLAGSGMQMFRKRRWCKNIFFVELAFDVRKQSKPDIFFF